MQTAAGLPATPDIVEPEVAATQKPAACERPNTAKLEGTGSGGDEHARSAPPSAGRNVTPLPDQAADHFFFLPTKIVEYPPFFRAPMV